MTQAYGLCTAIYETTPSSCSLLVSNSILVFKGYEKYQNSIFPIYMGSIFIYNAINFKFLKIILKACIFFEFKR